MTAKDILLVMNTWGIYQLLILELHVSTGKMFLQTRSHCRLQLLWQTSVGSLLWQMLKIIVETQIFIHTDPGVLLWKKTGKVMVMNIAIFQSFVVSARINLDVITH